MVLPQVFRSTNVEPEYGIQRSLELAGDHRHHRALELVHFLKDPDSLRGCDVGEDDDELLLLEDVALLNLKNHFLAFEAIHRPQRLVATHSKP